ncbi:hypothetical protein A2U01_0017481, partial [Trifolium medium]|nr:hypothetical protein [Trifolium medium]
MDTEADAGISKSFNDNVHNLQAQIPPISSPHNQSHPETNDDIDPALLNPINVIHPPQVSGLPNISSDTDIDTVTDAVKLATEIHKNKTNEVTSLLNQLHETQPQTQSQQSSPLQILEQHLHGELPLSPEPTCHIISEPQNTTTEAEKIQE